ncbi:hypothetical protein BSPWISOX_1549 [uncultured Gammaproteobacteria bacterium]|jgi:hypothetical protein|nr:hypothetical protein BSPWISOX_1549 [uncultured Gammaproteobacteria bacterium]
MIIDKDTNPTRDVYYLGSELLAVLEQQSAKKVDFFVAFDLLKKQTNISMSLYILTIDWLFLLGSVRSYDGAIEKCF